LASIARAGNGRGEGRSNNELEFHPVVSRAERGAGEVVNQERRHEISAMEVTLRRPG